MFIFLNTFSFYVNNFLLKPQKKNKMTIENKNEKAFLKYKIKIKEITLSTIL